MTPALATLHLSSQEGRLSARSGLRLPPVASLLKGLSGEEAVSRLSLIYRQCGEAQRWAAVGLIEQEQGVQPKAVTHAARDQALALEWLTEHSWQLWRIAHEVLPPAQERLTLLTRWRQALTEHRDALCALRHLPGASVSPVALCSLKPWIGEWDRWVWQPLMAEIERQNWNPLFVTPSAIHRRESGPASRTGAQSPRLSHRLTALWGEMWQAAEALSYPGSLTGMDSHVAHVVPGRVPAARGTLTHECQWQDGRVAHYGIHIPTEDTLAAIAQSLDGLAMPEQENWKRALGVWILAHAPCLEVAIVDVTEAAHA